MVRGTKTGVVDTRSLWKIAQKETDILKQRQRISANILEIDPDSLVFSILLDVSFSMASERIQYATQGVAVLGEALNHLGIPFGITGYSAEDCLLRLIFKRFHEPYPAVRTRLVNTQTRNGTFTSEHIPFAVRQFQSRRERKKVLLIITDAESIESEYRLKRAIAQAKAEGIFLAGIDIKTKLMRKYFDRFIELEDLTNFGQEVQGLLREILR